MVFLTYPNTYTHVCDHPINAQVWPLLSKSNCIEFLQHRKSQKRGFMLAMCERSQHVWHPWTRFNIIILINACMHACIYKKYQLQLGSNQATHTRLATPNKKNNRVWNMVSTCSFKYCMRFKNGWIPICNLDFWLHTFIGTMVCEEQPVSYNTIPKKNSSQLNWNRGSLKWLNTIMTLGWNLSIDKLGCSTSQVPDMASTKNNSKANLGLRLVEWAHTKHYSWWIRLNKRLLSIPYYFQKRLAIYILYIYAQTQHFNFLQETGQPYNWQALRIHGTHCQVEYMGFVMMLPYWWWSMSCTQCRIGSKKLHAWHLELLPRLTSTQCSWYLMFNNGFQTSPTLPP